VLENIKWSVEIRVTSQLIPNPKNPRQIDATRYKQLAECIREFGLIDKPSINLDNMIITGHQRFYIMQAWGVERIPCMVPDRMLTEAEIDALCIKHNLLQGEFDFDILANEWELDALIEYGFDPKELGVEISPKKTPKAQIVFEFTDKETMLGALEKLESVNGELGATMKVRG